MLTKRLLQDDAASIEVEADDEESGATSPKRQVVDVGTSIRYLDSKGVESI